ncbi:MAG: acetate--CoA ligase [Candidatus Lindowbacteria bacterium RIFCSPLOWO2_12_FULL_62_27]|nr:MAG: acetate--CoA ligase [Candidatus Lindowbacteria bacterium RIFCSPLOWO2_12_FULL_62_27]OGH61534.1 MAG: acetate--CoA ligase [Candidatus Lindowbacteria bacterium RIFCSPLOWO2_02_FULL_62_12]
MTVAGITSVQKEGRVFRPPKGFQKRAHIKSMVTYEKMYRQAYRNPGGFWAKAAKELVWFKPWSKALVWNAPDAKWFVGGKLNVSYNCLDRHLSTWRRNKAAIVWEGEPGDQRTLTYQQLYHEVIRFACVLKSLGVKPGDRVAIYLPMIPEAAIAMLACARIGAPHSVVFGGFSAQALKDRILDAGATCVITSDGGYRRGGIVPLKVNVDESLKGVSIVRHVLVVRRTGTPVSMAPGRDVWLHERIVELAARGKFSCRAEELDSEHPLFILYTSGTTGKPKGIYHSTGGYLTQVSLTCKWIFDLKDEDTFWCTADIGWVTGHSYVVYGPLANGATTFMYEGAPNHPGPDRFWDMIDRHRINIFYTAPTAIRAFIKWGDDHPKKHDLSSLRLLGTVGEPINPEAWMWYHRVIGGGRCPIVDTWWQTETGAILISPLPGATPTKPGSATRPFPGIVPDVVHKDGTVCKPNEGGYLVLKRPWPGMLRGIWGDPERYKKQYYGDFDGIYFTGDGARRDKDGYYWVMGRVDDVINVAGHRLGTAEIESALVLHESVAESAVVGRPDDLKGSAIVAFVTLKGGQTATPELKDQLKAHVGKEIGSIAKPDDIRFTDALPKTRSGKIMRRLLRELATQGEVRGDTTTLEDFSVLEKLRSEEE